MLKPFMSFAVLSVYFFCMPTTVRLRTPSDGFPGIARFPLESWSWNSNAIFRCSVGSCKFCNVTIRRKHAEYQKAGTIEYKIRVQINLEVALLKLGNQSPDDRTVDLGPKPSGWFKSYYGMASCTMYIVCIIY